MDWGKAKMATTEIQPEKWKIFLECPNCKREKEVTNQIVRRGKRYQFQINIPKICIYCEMDKEGKNDYKN